LGARRLEEYVSSVCSTETRQAKIPEHVVCLQHVAMMCEMYSQVAAMRNAIAEDNITQWFSNFLKILRNDPLAIF